jgi:hypothetical protein
MLKPYLLGVAMAAVLAATAARAEEAGRYTFDKSANGIARLDTRTGEVSMCQEQSGQLVCRMAADESRAYRDEIDRLEGKVDGLEKRLAELEKRVVSPKDLLPSDEQVDRTLGIMERFFRRFVDIARDLDKSLREDAPPDSTPQKT